MRIEFDVTNLDVILDKLEDAIDDDTIRSAVGKACAVVERSAKEKAPKDTGALRRSITSEVTDEDGAIIGTIFTPLEYAPYVEYGTGLFAESGKGRQTPWSYQDDEGNWHTTRGQKPQPFMRPALDENREKIVRLIKEGVLK